MRTSTSDHLRAGAVAAHRRLRRMLDHVPGPVLSLILHVIIVFALVKLIIIEKPPPDQDAVEVRMEIEEMPDLDEPLEPEPLEELDQMTPNDVPVEAPEPEAAEMEDVLAVDASVESPLKMDLSALGDIRFEGVSGLPKTTQFMGTSATGNRCVFVIDYSKSMSADQLRVMKYELTKAVRGLRGSLVSIIFFSGPVWRPDQSAQAATKIWTGSNQGGWKLKEDAKDQGQGPHPQYMLIDDHNLNLLRKMIYETPTTYGTDWYTPFKYALELEPPANMIVFMTDGAVNRGRADATIEMVRERMRPGLRINTVALGIGEDRAAPLKQLAEMTNGEFRLYNSTEIKDLAQELPAPPEAFDAEGAIRFANAATIASAGAKPEDAVIRDDVTIILTD
jgi:hypothetical protein